MKVKVTEIKWPYSDASTEALVAIIRSHASDTFRGHISLKQIIAITDVLAERYRERGYFEKTTEEAWDDFCDFYLPENLIRPEAIRIKKPEKAK